MKFINKLLIVAMLLVFAACEDTEFDLLDNPNAATPDQANPDDLFVSVQGSFDGIFQGAWATGAAPTRMVSNTGGFTYLDLFGPPTFNGIWYNAYAALFPDIDAIVSIADERGLDIHAGAAKILKAYAMVTLVDWFGNVPFSEAGQGAANLSPRADSGADIYAAAESLLDEAIAQLTDTKAAAPRGDIVYDGDPVKWIKAANTIKLKMYLTTRLVDGSAGSKIDAIIAGGNFITDAADDFQGNYGNQRTNPNSRHPFYNNAYENDDGTYMSNYYMWLLAGEKLDENDRVVFDPRRRFYFYRQTPDAFGQDVNIYSCFFSETNDQEQLENEKPDHYLAVDPRMPYCVLENGYYGRDHMNGSGIPPDGPVRTVYGLYPGGGLFDDDTFEFTQNQGVDGGLGEGISPYLLSSYVDFMRAEAALTLGTSDDPREMLASGIKKSMDKVVSFTSLVPGQMSRTVVDPVTGEENTIEDIFVPSDSTVQSYIDFVLGQYDAAADDDERLNVIIKEYHIALFGNGIEPYNNYRRTGKPVDMQPALEPSAGDFIRSHFYPNNYVDLNQNASQKNLVDQVFWDTNPPGFIN